MIVRNRPLLVDLNFSENQMGDENMPMMCNVMMELRESLEKVHLNDNGITEKGAQDLGDALACMKTLKMLRLNGNPLGTRGAEFILQVRSSRTRTPVACCLFFQISQPHICALVRSPPSLPLSLSLSLSFPSCLYLPTPSPSLSPLPTSPLLCMCSCGFKGYVHAGIFYVEWCDGRARTASCRVFVYR